MLYGHVLYRKFSCNVYCLYKLDSYYCFMCFCVHCLFVSVCCTMYIFNKYIRCSSVLELAHRTYSLNIFIFCHRNLTDFGCLEKFVIRLPSSCHSQPITKFKVLPPVAKMKQSQNSQNGPHDHATPPNGCCQT